MACKKKIHLNLPCLPHILKCTKYSCDHSTCTLQIVHSKYVLFNQTTPKYFAGKARNLKLNSKGIPCNLLIWWFCENGPLLPRLFASGEPLCRVFAIHMLQCMARAMCWAGLSNPCRQEPPFAFFFFSVHALTSHLRPEGSNCSTTFKKKNSRTSASFQPHPTSKTKCFV